jgi:hypothetical protein
VARFARRPRIPNPGEAGSMPGLPEAQAVATTGGHVTRRRRGYVGTTVFGMPAGHASRLLPQAPGDHSTAHVGGRLVVAALERMRAVAGVLGEERGRSVRIAIPRQLLASAGRWSPWQPHIGNASASTRSAGPGSAAISPARPSTSRRYGPHKRLRANPHIRRRTAEGRYRHREHSCAGRPDHPPGQMDIATFARTLVGEPLWKHQLEAARSTARTR